MSLEVDASQPEEPAKKFLLVTDGSGRQIIGWIPEYDEVLIGEMDLRDPMFFHEAIQQTPNGLAVQLVVRPIYLSEDLDTIKVMAMSIIELSLDGKILESYRQQAEQIRLQLRAQRAGIVLGGAMPPGPGPLVER